MLADANSRWFSTQYTFSHMTRAGVLLSFCRWCSVDSAARVTLRNSSARRWACQGTCRLTLTLLMFTTDIKRGFTHPNQRCIISEVMWLLFGPCLLCYIIHIVYSPFLYKREVEMCWMCVNTMWEATTGNGTGPTSHRALLDVLNVFTTVTWCQQGLKNTLVSFATVSPLACSSQCCCHGSWCDCVKPQQTGIVVL